MQFENWLGGISYYSQNHNVRLSILWALKERIVLCKKKPKKQKPMKTTYQSFFVQRKQMDGLDFSSNFHLAYLRGIYLAVNHVM